MIALHSEIKKFKIVHMFCTITTLLPIPKFINSEIHRFRVLKYWFSFRTILNRALSLRDLVSGNECGRVFSAGVRPASPSRDAANWLPSRFSLSVETRRRYGWLRMVSSLVRASSEP